MEIVRAELDCELWHAVRFCFALLRLLRWDQDGVRAGYHVQAAVRHEGANDVDHAKRKGCRSSADAWRPWNVCQACQPPARVFFDFGTWL